MKWFKKKQSSTEEVNTREIYSGKIHDVIYDFSKGEMIMKNHTTKKAWCLKMEVFDYVP